MAATALTPHLHAPDQPELVRAPRVNYVSVLGDGAPGTDEFYRKKILVSDIARQLTRRDTTPVVELQFWYPEGATPVQIADRSEEHTSELQSLMRISYAVFCLKKKKNTKQTTILDLNDILQAT